MTRSMDVIGGKGVDSVLSSAKVGDKSRLHNMREAELYGLQPSKQLDELFQID